MRILYYGPFRDGSGYSVAARGYLKGFDKLIQEGEDLDLRLMTLDLEQHHSRLSTEHRELIEKYEFTFDKRTGETSEKEVEEWIADPEPFMFIWHQPAPMITWERYHSDPFWNTIKALLKAAKWNVTFTVWEADKIHPGWVDTYNVYDTCAAILPSKYNHRVFEEGLPKHIKPYYIPHPVEQKDIGESKAISLPISLEDKFVIFSMSQWGVRKGFGPLLLAYYLEFGHQQDVALVLKTNGSIMNQEANLVESNLTGLQKQKRAIVLDAMQYKEMVFLDAYMEKPTCDVVLLTDFLAKENIQWLYEQADIFALPVRAEGFGLTLAEAIINKVPLVTTRTSGHEEFISPHHPFLIKGSYEPYRTKSEFTQNMNWFEPSVNSIRLNLRSAYNLWKRKNNPDPDWNHDDYLAKYAEDQLTYFEKQNYTVERVANDLRNMYREVSDE